MTKYGLWFLSFLFIIPALAQEPTKPLIVELSGGYGFLIPHRPVMRHIPQQHVPSLELYVGTKLNGDGVVWKGKKAWHHLHNNQEVGFSYLFTGTGNKDLMGYGMAFLTNMSFPLNKNEHFHVFLRSGIGPGYITRTFELHDNLKNVAIGSHLNMCVKLGLHARLNIDNTYLSAGISMVHFSNGAMVTPNLGINLPAANLTLGHQFGEYKPTDQVGNKTHLDKFDLITVLSMGIKENYPAGGEKFAVYNIQNQFRHFISAKTGIIAGLDFMYNSARIAQISYESGEDIQQKYRFIRPGLNVGYARIFNRLSFFVQSGLYLLNYEGRDGLIYNRVGGTMIFKKWVAHFALKSHLSKADHFEIGIGKQIVRKSRVKINFTF